MTNVTAIGIHVHAERNRLRQTLAALRAHTSPGYELLLLADGPDDETRAALASLADIALSGTQIGPPVLHSGQARGSEPAARWVASALTLATTS